MCHVSAVVTTIFSCTIFSDMVCSLLSKWCVDTSFYQRAAILVFFICATYRTLSSGSVFDVAAAREAWSEMITQCEADKLVFLDESGVNTDLSHRYGRAIGGERSVDKTPLNTPANTTILSSIRRNGETAYTIYSGGTTHEKFLDYLKNTLIPTLHEGDIVIIDNSARIADRKSAVCGGVWRRWNKSPQNFMKIRYAGQSAAILSRF